MQKRIKKLAKRWHQFKEHPVAGRNIRKAYLKYIEYHLFKRFIKKRKYSWVGPLKFFARPGDAGINPNIFLGLYEFRESLFLMHFLRSSDLFLDIGANLGHYSLLASGITSCRSLAIEPVQETYAQLEKQVKLNQLSSLIKLMNVGVSSQEGELYFSTDKTTMNHCVDKNYPGKAEKISVTTIDQLSKSKVPTLIKIDVEGYEKFILEGGLETLIHPELKAVIIEINGSGKRYGVSDQEVSRLLIEKGFEPFHYLPHERNLAKLQHFNTEQFNTIFIRDLRMVEGRIKEARPVTIWDKNY